MMKKIGFLYVAINLFTISGLFGNVLKLGEYSDKAIRVSMMELIVRPKEFDGKLVQVTGFISVASGWSVLYFSEEKMKLIDVSNGIVLRREAIGNADIIKEILESKTSVEPPSEAFDFWGLVVQGVFRYNKDADLQFQKSILVSFLSQ